jgi:poly(3-hydroxybutyrate) depolymerase
VKNSGLLSGLEIVPPAASGTPGCGLAPPAIDSQTVFARHDLDVSGVDPAFIAAYPAQPPLPYNWTHRNYYLRLPAGYDPSRTYPVVIGGPGCGGTSDSSGQSVSRVVPAGQAIEVGLSYVVSAAATSCFADHFTNSPDVPYFDAVLADLQGKYCVDTGKVFVHGFSTGATMSLVMGHSRSSVVRAVGTAAGQERKIRPPGNGPFAAMLVAGINDTSNPIGPVPEPGATMGDNYGLTVARDEILAGNGCVGSATTPWDASYPSCVKYTGCPASYPVVWCATDDGHGVSSNPAYTSGLWKFWNTLPAR